MYVGSIPRQRSCIKAAGGVVRITGKVWQLKREGKIIPKKHKQHFTMISGFGAASFYALSGNLLSNIL
jgi:hypothetical protein